MPVFTSGRLMTSVQLSALISSAYLLSALICQREMIARKIDVPIGVGLSRLRDVGRIHQHGNQRRIRRRHHVDWLMQFRGVTHHLNAAMILSQHVNVWIFRFKGFFDDGRMG